MKIKNIIFSAVCCLLLCTPETFPFGKNKVITKDFNWQICPTEHFDIYYYDEGKNVLPHVIDILENAHAAALADYNCEISSRTPFFLYVGHNDFEQTNIVSIGEGTGGVTEAFKNRFIVPHLGPLAWLEDVLRHEFTHVVEFNVLYGGFWKSVRLIKSIIYPNWLMEGMAVYSEREWDKTELDMYMRDAVCQVQNQTSSEAPDKDEYNRLLPLGYLHNFNHVKPHQVVLAYKESGTLIGFIAEEYGRDTIREILTTYRDNFDPNTVLSQTLGLTLFELDRKFREYVKEKYNLDREGLREAETYGRKLTKPEMFYGFNTNPVFLSSGEKTVYITDRNGYNEIVLMDIKTGELKSLISRKNFNKVENTSRSGKGISITADDNYMIFIGEKLQKDYVYLYDFRKNRFKKLKIPFEIIDSADISPDGEKIIFVAMKDGFRNIYSINTDGGNLVKLTEGTDDVSDARISPDGKFVVFSKEVRVDSEAKYYQRDLWMLSLEDSSTVKLTGMPNDETSPCISPDNKTVVFVSDQDNVYNLYSVDLETKDIKRLTRVIGGNFNPSFSNDGKKIIFSSFRYGEKHIYTADIDNFDHKPVFQLPATPGVSTQSLTQVPEVKPYRFSVSTDLFFPLFMYSTYEGAYLALYWQISEMLGNHSLNIYTQYYELARYIDYEITYNYLRFRPQFFFSVKGQGGYDWTRENYNISQAQTAGLRYPFNRFNRIEFAVGNVEDRNETIINGVKTDETVIRKHLGLASFIRDTTKGKYMEVTSGSRFRLSLEGGTEAFGGDREYQNPKFELHKFLPLGKEHTIASRLTGGSITGKDSYRYTYKLIGYSGVRMRRGDVPYELNYGRNMMLTNIEWRFPIVSDLNYHMWYMFPDFLFRSFYGIFFVDAGLVWDNGEPKLENSLYSYGVGLKFHTFILQMYPFSLNFIWAYSPINDKTQFYFLFGPVF
jgi:Tol biopolymer transport system component